VKQSLNKIAFLSFLFLAILLGLAVLFKFEFLASLSHNLSAHLYTERPVSEEIVIVALDEKSMSSPETGGLGSLREWSRLYYQKVAEEINAGDPSAIAFDILFNANSSGLTRSELYSIAKSNAKISDFTRTALSYLNSPHPNDVSLAKSFAEIENLYLIKSYSGAIEYQDTSKSFLYENSIEPSAEIKETVQMGFANVVDAQDKKGLSMIYQIPAFFSDGITKEPHLDLQLAALKGTDLEKIPLETGQMLINYAAPAYSFKMVSFSDVYFGRIPPSTFKNKIVFVGPTATSMQDQYFTPIDQHTPMPGVEIHANAIQTILDGAFLVNQKIGGFLVMVGAMVLMVSVASLFLPIWAGAVVALATLTMFPFFAQWRFDQGVIVNLIWPVVAVVIAYLAVLAYRYGTEFKEKRKLKSAFGHYVSPELVEQISEHPELLKLGGERRHMSTLFLDIENFTTLSESLDPTEVVKIINLYFDALAKVIMSEGGTVDKFEGDAIMALFGAPLPTQDHAVKACRAALAIRARMLELNQETGQNLNVRIGIASGDCIVGNMGSSLRFDYTAMGDTVNTASRLEGGNKFYGTRILVNPGTCEEAQNEFAFRQIDTVRLKGKEQAIAIHEVMGLKSGLSAEGSKILTIWNEMLEFYRQAKWNDAEDRLTQVATLLPEDGPSKTYRERIQKLREFPPENWDGTWKFDSK
jgi:adenylate cyclase